MMRCVFCKEDREEVLHKHHVYPKFIIDRYAVSEAERQREVTMCRNCHAILHEVILMPIEDAIKRKKGG